MLGTTMKRRGAMIGSALAAGGLLASAFVTSASADPRHHTDQVVGTGSDTTQEVLAAFGGEAAGQLYTPLSSPYGATGRTVISSWHATAPTDQSAPARCIAPRALFNAIQRPNGSSQGRMALSRAYDGGGLKVKDGDTACANKSTAGIVDFARSSSGSSGGTTELTYIPFAKDALTYAITRVDGAAGDAGDTGANTSLSFADLQAIFKSGGTGHTIGSTLYIPCDIQNGSGTHKDWPGKIGGGVTLGQIDTASDRCEQLGNVGTDTTGDIQEHKADLLEEKADLFESANPGVSAQLLIGFSVSNYIAQANGASPNDLHPDVTLGSAVPDSADGDDTEFTGNEAVFTGTAPNLVGNPDFFNATTTPSPGRLVYNVLLTETLDLPGNDGLKALFVGKTSAVCLAGTTIEKFGYAQLTATSGASSCGDTSTKGALVANDG